MQGTFLHKYGSFRPTDKCSVHGTAIIRDPIVGTMLYLEGDPQPKVFPAVAERCPDCHPTIEAMMKFCVSDFIRKLAASGGPPIKIKKIAIIWKDGHKDEHEIEE